MSELTSLATVRLTPLEVASDFMPGFDPLVPPLPTGEPAVGMRSAIEDVLRRSLERPPCVISFSGGRDSSALLAIATHVARRDGLPTPVAATLRFPACADTSEDDWQDQVIARIGVTDWVKLTFDDELDLLGPYSRRLLELYGTQWPSNVYSHLPIAELTAGGTMVTGFGGDELLTPPHPLYMRVNRVLGRQARFDLPDLRRLIALYGPVALRRIAARRRMPPVGELAWLRPVARRAVTEAAINDMVAVPPRWDDSIDLGWWQTRYRSTVVQSLRQVAATYGAAVCNPFAEPAVLSATAAEGGRVGFSSRTEAMHRLVADLLPDPVLARVSKAEFRAAFWNRSTIAFAADWDGSGVDPDLVDVDVLRSMWRQADPLPDGRSHLLLKAIWLATVRS